MCRSDMLSCNHLRTSIGCDGGAGSDFIAAFVVEAATALVALEGCIITVGVNAELAAASDAFAV